MNINGIDENSKDSLFQIRPKTNGSRKSNQKKSQTKLIPFKDKPSH